MKIMQRNRKKSKKKRAITLSTRQLIILGCVAAVIIVAFFASMFVVLGSYNGLGMSQSIPKNEYDTTKFYFENGLMKYSDTKYKSVNGIDVSTYQKKIDWEKVKSIGIDFAMIRIGYSGSKTGEIVMDDRFEENLEGAKAAGLDVGVYFFSQAINIEEAENEAKFVIRHIRGEGISYPVAFDMEPISNDDRISQLTQTQKTEICDAFCSIIKANGYAPMVYGNPSWLKNSIDMAYLSDYQVWLAHYERATGYSNKFNMWQYSNSGTVPGVKMNVDMNIMLVEK